MRAFQYLELGQPARVVEVDKPIPESGQVLLRVLAAGACHSDLSIMRRSAADYRHGFPLILGHEGVGEIVELGSGVNDVAIGDQVAVYGAWGCGRCVTCVRGEENYCPHAATLGIKRPGLGAPGAMAEYMIVDKSTHLVPLDGLDPVSAVCLTDAGLTPYHAIKGELGSLGPGSVAAVIGVGGLGHVGLQILRALTPAHVVACDPSIDKRELAAEVGAHVATAPGTDFLNAIGDLTRGVGADVVFDFVATHGTLDVARQAVRMAGSIQIVGGGGGVLAAGPFSTPFGSRTTVPFWGGITDLHEVMALARQGHVRVRTREFELADAPTAYAMLESSDIQGRAVIVPDGSAV